MAHELVLVVTETMAIHQAIASALGECGRAPIVASTAHEAMAILSHHPISLVFCDEELPDGGIYVLIRQQGGFRNRVPVVVISRHDDWNRYLDFLQYGAFDYMLHPLDGREVERMLRNVASLSTSRQDGRSRHFCTRQLFVHALSQFSHS